MESSTLNDTQLNALFSSHNLDYTPPESSNLILSRESCDKQSTLNEYKSGSNNSIDVYIGSDNQLLWGPTSYLSFDLKYNKVTADLNAGDVNADIVSSIFSRITISCKGTIIYDVDAFNLLSNIQTRYSCPDDFSKNAGSIGGWDRSWRHLFQDKKSNDGYTRVAMPLHNISFFAQDKYIPLLALSPLKVSFYLNRAHSAFQTDADEPAGSYSIKDFKMNLDLFVPQDAVRVAILQLVKQQVLTLSYTHYNHLNSDMRNGSNTITLRKSVQKCQSIVTQIRNRYTDSKVEAKYNSLISVEYPRVDSWFYIAGCKRMPSNPVTNSVDAYVAALNAFGTFSSCTRNPSVSMGQFTGMQDDDSKADPTGKGLAVLAMDLEKDITAGPMLSGISLNSTDDISLNVHVNGITGGREFQADTFLSYLRLVVVGTSNISIKE